VTSAEIIPGEEGFGVRGIGRVVGFESFDHNRFLLPGAVNAKVEGAIE